MYHATAVGEIFTVDIVVHNLDAGSQLVGIEIRLGYNATLLQFLSLTSGGFLDPFAGPPNGGVQYLGPLNGSGFVMYAEYIAPDSNGTWHEPFPSGSGIFATVEFIALYMPATGPYGASCDLTLFATKFVDQAINLISHNDVNGHYDIGPYFSFEPATYHAMFLNEVFTVNIDINNLVDTSKVVGFDFKLRYNTTLLQLTNFTIGSFFEGFAGPPDQGMLYFGPYYGADYVWFAGFILPDVDGVWHEPFPSGSGTIATITFKAIYEPPAGTTEACDLTLYNTKLADTTPNLVPHNVVKGHYEIATPTLIGDLNFDGTVDILDALILANAFGSSPGDPRWNILADINHDGIVDIFDAILLAAHFGESE